MTDKVDNLREEWEKAERLASDHERAATENAHKTRAWTDDCFAVAELYNQLHLKHGVEHHKMSAKASRLEKQLKEALVEAIPKGAERVIPYLEYLEEGYLTYDQWEGIIKEQERERLEGTSEDSTP
jgi:hypothetical protein